MAPPPAACPLTGTGRPGPVPGTCASPGVDHLVSPDHSARSLSCSEGRFLLWSGMSGLGLFVVGISPQSRELELISTNNAAGPGRGTFALRAPGRPHLPPSAEAGVGLKSAQSPLSSLMRSSTVPGGRRCLCFKFWGRGVGGIGNLNMLMPIVFVGINKFQQTGVVGKNSSSAGAGTTIETGILRGAGFPNRNLR